MVGPRERRIVGRRRILEDRSLRGGVVNVDRAMHLEERHRVTRYAVVTFEPHHFDSDAAGSCDS